MGNLVCWRAATIAGLLGGVGAGANTRTGVRQGVGAGVFAAIGIIVAFSKGGLASFPVAVFWMDQINVNDGAPLVYAALAVNTIVTASIGGFLGAAIFTPRRR